MTEQPTLFTWPSLLKMALQHKLNFLLANLLAVISTLLYLPVPLIIPSLINEVLLKQPGFFTKILSYFLPLSLITPTLILITAFSLVLILRICVEFLTVWQGLEFKIISKDIIFNMRKKLLFQLQEISIKEYETLGSGKLVSYYIKDLDTIDDFLGETVNKAVIAILALIAILTLLFIINWKIALFIFLFNPFSLILTAKFSSKLKELKSKQNKAFELFQEAFIETIDAIVQIRADNKQFHFINRLVNLARQVKSDSIAYEWKTEVVSDLGNTLLFIGVDLYYIVCMTLILLNELSIGMMIALLQYVFQVQWYMNVIVNMQSAFYAADSALTRINQAMQLETEPKYVEKSNPFLYDSKISININNLHFSYLPKKPILTNINMLIEPHKRIAIVGPSGVGKSTWIQALLGFYPINKGEIKINNHSIYDIGFETIRENINTVLQSPIIFNDTVRNNLTLDSSISDDELWDVLHKAQLKLTVESFEDKLDTKVGRKGVRLSGGQRQCYVSL